ncbi:MAG TPA: hypothetical protein PKE21_13505 [Flavobacteriales bacterium]|nr:hypothetical protein [Flavobacteriales bacterium]HMR28492.1 hypothetical protein [Flavobacteriales bacterium]
MTVHRATWMGVFLLIAAGRTANGQSMVDHRWDHWYWGENNGWHFVNDTVVTLPGSPLPLTFKSVAMSDPSSGDLLFYGDLVTLWNADHQPLANNVGSFSSIGGSPQVVTLSAEPDKHILIFFAESNGPPSAGLWSATVDMDLANGLGDVIAPAALFAPERGLKWTPIPAITTDTTWILANEPATGSYYAYPWTVNGPGQAVLSLQGAEPTGNSHLMKVDRSGSRVAANTQYDQRLDLFRFDRTSGLLTDTLTVWMADIVGITGIEFAPSGTVLYVAVNYSITPRITDVLQFDLSLWNHAAVNTSRRSVADSLPEEQPVGKLQLGPDDRIYVARGHMDSTHLAVIMAPEALGTACDYRPNAIPLSGGRTIAFDVLNLPTLHWPIPSNGVGQVETGNTDRSHLVAWPNPAADGLNIALPRSSGPGSTIHLFDVVGSLKRSFEIGNDQTLFIPRGDLCDGFYTLHLLLAEGQHSATTIVFGPSP